MIGEVTLTEREGRHQNNKRKGENQRKGKRKWGKGRGRKKIHPSSPKTIARSGREPHKEGENFFYRE